MRRAKLGVRKRESKMSGCSRGSIIRGRSSRRFIPMMSRRVVEESKLIPL
jgi:hypothetical protein